MGFSPRFGTIEWAAVKAARACRHGLAVDRLDCHAKAGDWIRRNPALAADPDCRLVLFALPSGTVAHAAVLSNGELHHDVGDISGHALAGFNVAARIPAAVILDAAMSRPAPAVAAH